MCVGVIRVCVNSGIMLIITFDEIDNYDPSILLYFVCCAEQFD